MFPPPLNMRLHLGCSFVSSKLSSVLSISFSKYAVVVIQEYCLSIVAYYTLKGLYFKRTILFGGHGFLVASSSHHSLATESLNIILNEVLFLL